MYQQLFKNTCPNVHCGPKHNDSLVAVSTFSTQRLLQ